MSEHSTEQPRDESLDLDLVRASGVSRIFKGHAGQANTRALSSVDLCVAQGETLGLVGESGSGKSTLGRILVGLDNPTEGSVLYAGKQLNTKNGTAFRKQRQQVQFVFQDPMAALNPRLTVEKQVAEGYRAHNNCSWNEALEKARDFLEQVGVNRTMASRYVHQLSGGQRQRAVIARALVLEPNFVVFDEPVSALDLSIQAQILELINQLKTSLGLTAVFISHDLRVVRYISDRIAVLYLGRLVELGDSDDVFHAPKHPYTKSLLAALPHIDPHKQRPTESIVGEIKVEDSESTGCVFASRCPVRIDRCTHEVPELTVLPNGTNIACHLAESAS